MGYSGTIVDWAGEAGHTVDSTAVAQALAAENTFAEETLLNLLKVLGIASS